MSVRPCGNESYALPRVSPEGAGRFLWGIPVARPAHASPRPPPARGPRACLSDAVTSSSSRRFSLGESHDEDSSPLLCILSCGGASRMSLFVLGGGQVYPVTIAVTLAGLLKAPLPPCTTTCWSDDTDSFLPDAKGLCCDCPFTCSSRPRTEAFVPCLTRRAPPAASC